MDTTVTQNESTNESYRVGKSHQVSHMSKDDPMSVHVLFIMLGVKPRAPSMLGNALPLNFTPGPGGDAPPPFFVVLF
jgi:hypothetical protein